MEKYEKPAMEIVDLSGGVILTSNCPDETIETPEFP